jgi:hypothetical protein
MGEEVCEPTTYVTIGKGREEGHQGRSGKGREYCNR